MALNTQEKAQMDALVAKGNADPASLTAKEASTLKDLAARNAGAPPSPQLDKGVGKVLGDAPSPTADKTLWQKTKGWFGGGDNEAKPATPVPAAAKPATLSEAIAQPVGKYKPVTPSTPATGSTASRVRQELTDAERAANKGELNSDYYTQQQKAIDEKFQAQTDRMSRAELIAALGKAAGLAIASGAAGGKGAGQYTDTLLKEPAKDFSKDYERIDRRQEAATSNLNTERAMDMKGAEDRRQRVMDALRLKASMENQQQKSDDKFNPQEMRQASLKSISDINANEKMELGALNNPDPAKHDPAVIRTAKLKAYNGLTKEEIATLESGRPSPTWSRESTVKAYDDLFAKAQQNVRDSNAELRAEHQQGLAKAKGALGMAGARPTLPAIPAGAPAAPAPNADAAFIKSYRARNPKDAPGMTDAQIIALRDLKTKKAATPPRANTQMENRK